MDLKRKYAQLFEGKLRSNDRSLLIDQSKAEVLETIVKEANEIPSPEDIISDGMDEVNRVIDELLDLEQSVMSSIEMYQEETGDLRFEQILNQGARYIQSAQRNLEYLHKMLKRNL